MNFIWDKLTEWIRELLIEGIMNNLTGLFDQVNTQISGIADNVGKTPQQWNGSIFSMIQGLSDHVVVPIAGAILAVIATLELIQLIIDKNNFHDFDTFIIFNWVFKTAASVLIVSNTWNIVMGIFEAAQSVASRASGLVMSGAQLSIESAITGIEARLADMELGALFGLWFQTMLIGFMLTKTINAASNVKEEPLYISVLTIRKIIDLLRRAFQYAVNRDLVAQNPFENAILPKTDILKKGVREIDY